MNIDAIKKMMMLEVISNLKFAIDKKEMIFDKTKNDFIPLNQNAKNYLEYVFEDNEELKKDCIKYYLEETN